MRLKGCGTALVTPFRDGAVDYEAYKALVLRQVNAGIDFLVPLGTTAETPCLDDGEKTELLRLARELCPDRPVVAGVGTNSPAQTIRNIRLLEPLGPDAFLVVVPYYNKPTQEGMYQYFKLIAESTSKPIVLYNVPGRTGANMKAETTLRAAKIPNVAAVKEASGDLDQIRSVIAGREEGFSVLSGNDDQTLDLMRSGGDGVISVASNIAPELVIELVRKLQAGDPHAYALNEKLMPLFKNCFAESNPIPVKAALALQGIGTPEMRLPLTAATPATVELMQKTLNDLGIL